jgi:hypothetical protein
MATNLKNLL